MNLPTPDSTNELDNSKIKEGGSNQNEILFNLGNQFTINLHQQWTIYFHSPRRMRLGECT